MSELEDMSHACFSANCNNIEFSL